MKPINVSAVFFAQEKVMFPIKTDPLRYYIQYDTRTINDDILKKIDQKVKQATKQSLCSKGNKKK